MQVVNCLPVLSKCLHQWESPPTLIEFTDEYFRHVEPHLRPMLEDWGMESAVGMYSELLDLNWAVYREQTLHLDPEFEERRVRENISRVEELLGEKLGGEAIVFGAFTMMDGYARFDRGRHRVYLGVDENHGRGRYLDVLIAHEITHAARESQASVWAGFGLDVTALTHDDFTEKLPVIEHLFNEGFSCAISEILHPDCDPWNYAYQNADSLAKVLEHGPAMDREIRAELRHPDGDYGRLYNPSRYGKRMPSYCHYVWAWKWARSVIDRHGGGDPKQVLKRCSAEFMEDALAFELR